jgi:hypothetical protein
MPTLNNDQASEAARQPASKPTTNAVNALVRSLGDLDPAGQTRAAIARQLARKMDQPGTGATSLALLSRELRSVLTELIDPSHSNAAEDLIRSIFA